MAKSRVINQTSYPCRILYEFMHSHKFYTEIAFLTPMTEQMNHLPYRVNAFDTVKFVTFSVLEFYGGEKRMKSFLYRTAKL